MNVNTAQLSFDDQEYLYPERKEIISEGLKKLLQKNCFLKFLI